MFATEVFEFFSSWTKVPIESVRQIGRKNQVWLGSTRDGTNFVLKEFDSDHHSNSHFLAESVFLKENQDLAFIPQLVHLDEIKKLFVTRHYKSSNESQVSLEEILNAIDTYCRLPIPSYIAHDDPPGVLGWGSTKSRLNTNAENIVLNVVRESDWFEPLVLNCNNLWSKDAVIHADMKLSNIILGQDSIKIIDWENVSLGDVDWDISGIIQSLFLEVFTNSKDSPWCRDQLLNLESSDFSLSGRAIDFLALRAVQTATELCQNSTMIPESAVRMLELAESTCETGKLEIGRFLNA